MKVRDKRIKIDIIDTPEGNFSWGIYKNVRKAHSFRCGIDSTKQKNVHAAIANTDIL